MLDVDGDGQIEFDEFMETVKVSLVAEQGEAGGMSARTRSVMDSLASTLTNSVVSMHAYYATQLLILECIASCTTAVVIQLFNILC
jgi:hypothetical protein